MTRFASVFPGEGRRVLLPVIHYRCHHLAMRSIDASVRAGADGVLLINQGTFEGDKGLALEKLRDEAKREHPGLWVGVNMLGTAPEAWEGYDGTWADNAYPRGADGRPSYLDAMERWRETEKRPGYLYLGGVAFKYQARVSEDDLTPLTMKASQDMDVVVTSGDRTGLPPTPQKIRTMREATEVMASLGSVTPIGIASGISVDNVRNYLADAQVFIVASSIEDSFGVINYDRAARLADLIHRTA